MSRMENKQVMGFFEILPEHYDAILSLISGSRQRSKILDPFAGEGKFMLAAETAWNVNAYVNELDSNKSAELDKLFVGRSVTGPAENLFTTKGAYPIIWCNPPYDHDKFSADLETGEVDNDAKRVEYQMLHRSWEWLANGGLMMWVVYQHHITNRAAGWLSRNSSSVDVWALPGKHLGEYDQVIVVAQKTKVLKTADMPEAIVLRDKILAEKESPRILTVQEKPVYEFPIVNYSGRFYFSTKVFTTEMAQAEIAKAGAWSTGGFMNIISGDNARLEMNTNPIMRTRPGHTALALAGGALDGQILDTVEYGRVAINAQIQKVESEDSFEVIPNPKDKKASLRKMIVSMKPRVRFNLLSNDGVVSQLVGDDAILSFIGRNTTEIVNQIDTIFKPVYQFDFAGVKTWLDRVRVNGEHKLYTAQKHVIAATVEAFKTRNGVTMVGQMGTGKAQPLDAKVLTPNGWVLMGDIQSGDVVVNPDGGNSTVVGVYPQGEKDIYQITFSDGSVAESCEDHLWAVTTPWRKWMDLPNRVRSLKEIASRPLAHKNGNLQNFIPMVAPVEFEETELPIDPYLLGVLLGDGYIGKRGQIGFASEDYEIVESVSNLVPADVEVSHNAQYDYVITTGHNANVARNSKGQFTTGQNSLLSSLRELGLSGTHSNTKFIPHQYIYNSVANRVAILQGLLDTDGSAFDHHAAEYSTASKQLRDGVKEIVQSLGGRVTISERETTGLLSYRMYISLPNNIAPFRLTRKANVLSDNTKYEPTRAIARIELVGRKQAQCIMLDSDNHLYVTDDYIVTHNTSMGGSAAVVMIQAGAKAALASMGGTKKNQVSLVVCPPHLANKWKRELLALDKKMYVKVVGNYTEMKAYMDGVSDHANVTRIAIIKRSTVALGSGAEGAAITRKQHAARWNVKQNAPYGDNSPRVVTNSFLANPETGEKIGALTQKSLGDKRVWDELTPLFQTVRTPSEASFIEITGRKKDAPLNDKGKMLAQTIGTPAPYVTPLPDVVAKHSDPALYYPSKNPRMRLDEYIKTHYRHQIYMLIWDEIHEAQKADTGRGEAFARLACVAKKTLALTGTPINGKASSIFNLEYSINPDVQKAYAFRGAERYTRKNREALNEQTKVESNLPTRGGAEKRWVNDMGVLSKVIEDLPVHDKTTGRYTGTKTYDRGYEEAPGVNPLLIATILHHSIFFFLKDLGKHLPKYEEHMIAVDLDGDIAEEFEEVDAKLRDYMNQLRWEGDNSFMGSWFQWSMTWPNTPYMYREVIHNKPLFKRGPKAPIIVHTMNQYDEDRMFNKEQALLDRVSESISEGRPCLIYIAQSDKRDIRPRIKGIVNQIEGARPMILDKSVAADRREAVINKWVAAGINIIICHPGLVETGLDLIPFVDIHVYEPVTRLATLLQATARSYRLNQPSELCRVFYYFYEGTPEHKMIKLMSRKQRASKMLTGDVGLTGLDELTENPESLERQLIDAVVAASEGNGESNFTIDASVIDAMDATFWGEEDSLETEDEDEAAKPLITVIEEVAEKPVRFGQKPMFSDIVPVDHVARIASKAKPAAVITYPLPVEQPSNDNGKVLIPHWLKKVLPLTNAHKSPEGEPIVYAKLFTPDANLYYWVGAYNPQGLDLLVYAVLNGDMQMSEWGVQYMDELTEWRGPAGLEMERDTSFEPCTLSQALADHEAMYNRRSVEIAANIAFAAIVGEDVIEEVVEEVAPVVVEPAKVAVIHRELPVADKNIHFKADTEKYGKYTMRTTTTAVFTLPDWKSVVWSNVNGLYIRESIDENGNLVAIVKFSLLEPVVA